MEVEKTKNKRRKDMAPDELKAVREADAARKRQDRADAKSLTAEGRKMALSQIVVKPADADEILKERGLHDVHSRSAHIRDTIYWLATQTAEYFHLPGPNWFLLRHGYYATAASLANPDFVPPVTPAEEMRLVSADDHDPDSDPPGELVTYFELYCVMEMQSWKSDDARGSRTEQQLLAELEAWKARKAMLEEKQAALQAADAAATSILERHAVDDWASWAIFMGEMLPDVECKTAAQLISSSRLFGRALGCEEPRENENCRTYVTRIYAAWRERKFPPLHAILCELDQGATEPPDFGIVDEYLSWPPDADAPIEIAKLLPLPAIPE